MAGGSKITTDKKTIQKWAEERGGKPATVKGTGGKADPGVIRFIFPGQGSDTSLKEIDWKDFFKKFEEKDLALLYQDTTRDNKISRFFKFVRKGGRRT